MALDPRIVNAFQAQNGFTLEPHLLVLGLMGMAGAGAGPFRHTHIPT